MNNCSVTNFVRLFTHDFSSSFNFLLSHILFLISISLKNTLVLMLIHTSIQFKFRIIRNTNIEIYCSIESKFNLNYINANFYRCFSLTIRTPNSHSEFIKSVNFVLDFCLFWPYNIIIIYRTFSIKKTASYHYLILFKAL